MVILEDTRNQPGKHKKLNEQLTGMDGVDAVERCKLWVGDYVIANDQSRSVDTKKDVLELIQDIYHDHERFKAECMRAKESGVQLLILIEEELPGGRLKNWRSPRHMAPIGDRKAGDLLTKADPAILRKAMKTMTERYDVNFRFCNKKNTGRIIYNFLTKGELP